MHICTRVLHLFSFSRVLAGVEALFIGHTRVLDKTISDFPKKETGFLAKVELSAWRKEIN